MAAATRSTWVRPESVLRWPRMPPVLARDLPAVVLVVASITYAEFLTGSTVVLAAVLDPVSLAFLLGLYGAGVLLVREASVRWGKGWPSILLLGAAYGIAEEGIGTKTFFGPAGVGSLAVYGHALGVNWVWAVELALFHAVFSIALPIATVALVFPPTRGVPFLPSRRAVFATLAIFLATVGTMFVLFNRPEIPSGALLLAAFVAIGVLGAAARRAPASLAGLGIAEARGPAMPAFVVGALFVWGFFGIVWIGPSLSPVPAVVIAFTLAWTGAVGWWVVRHRRGLEDARHRTAFAAGALSFLLVLGTVMGLFGDLGALPVVAAVIVGFVLLRRRLASAPVALRVPSGVPARP